MPARGALMDRGGGLIYDSVLNVTWLRDANYAQTMGYQDVGGYMNCFQASNWVNWLVYQGYNDWQLPPCGPINGSAANWNHPANPIYDGSADESYNVTRPGTLYANSTATALPNLFYSTLGNNGSYQTNGAFNSIARTNVGPFTNVRSIYWSAGSYPPFPNHDWYFDFSTGLQATGGMFYTTPGFTGWAVRPGDSAPLAGAVITNPVARIAWQGSQLVISWPSLAAGFFLKTSSSVNPAGVTPGDTNLAPADILDLGALEEKMRAPSDGLSTYISGLISPAVSNEIINYDHVGNPPDPHLQQDLAGEISRIMALGPFYTSSRLSGVPLSRWTKNLLAQNPQGTALLHLNRLLLEDAYPLEIYNSIWQTATNTSAVSPDRQTISVTITPSAASQYFILFRY